MAVPTCLHRGYTFPRGQRDRAPEPQWLLFPRVQSQPGSTPGTLTRTPLALAWPPCQPQQRPGQMCAPQHPATGPAHGEGGHVELLEPRLGDSCLRTLTQDEGADAMPAPGQPGVTSVPSTSVCAESVWCLHLPALRVYPGAHLCPSWLPAFWGGCATIRAALGGASPARVLPARFLPSPWSRRDRLGNPIMVRLRRRVDFGFMAVSVLNRE